MDDDLAVVLNELVTRIKKVEENQAALEGAIPRVHRRVRNPALAGRSWGRGHMSRQANEE